MGGAFLEVQPGAPSVRSSAEAMRRRKGLPSMGIWELQRFEDERMPVLQENMATKCGKPWAKIEEVTAAGVTYYTIRLKTPCAETVHKKRYKDFLSYDKVLRSKASLREVLPPLPDAGVFGIRHAFGI